MMNRSNTLFLLVMFTLLGLVVALLLWRIDSDVQQYQVYQQDLMDKQAHVSANEIDHLIDSLRKRMVAVALDDILLQDMNDFASAEGIQEALFKRLKIYFPEMYAFTIADENGAEIGGDLSLFISDVCQTDLSRTAHKLKHKLPYLDYEPWIHPKPGAYHFDMMFPTLWQGKTVVFFMSFKASILYSALLASKISAHPIYLLRQDQQGLIEVGLQGVREQLQRPAILGVAEQALIKSRLAVPNTRWEVAIVANESQFNEFKKQRRFDGLRLFLVFLIMWLALFWFGWHQERKRNELLDKLSHLSLHDSLTGLANRRRLHQELTQTLQQACESGSYVGLLYLDLNGFKPINDEYGHAVGDEVLKIMAQRLKDAARHSDLIARMGGDEFVVVVRALGADLAEAQRIFDQIHQRFAEILQKRYHIAELTLACPPSIGALLVMDPSVDGHALLKIADEAMYVEKLRARNVTPS